MVTTFIIDLIKLKSADAQPTVHPPHPMQPLAYRKVENERDELTSNISQNLKLP